MMGKKREINKSQVIKNNKEDFHIIRLVDRDLWKVKAREISFFKIVSADRMQTTPGTTLWQS